MIFHKIKNKQKKSNSGFTLIELVVVMGIMGVMSSIILYNYAGFKSTASLDNLSQDIALSVREAQISAMGVKGLNIGMAQQFPGYGVHFKLSSLTAQNNATRDHNPKITQIKIPNNTRKMSTKIMVILKSLFLNGP